MNFGEKQKKNNIDHGIHNKLIIKTALVVIIGSTKKMGKKNYSDKLNRQKNKNCEIKDEITLLSSVCLRLSWHKFTR